MGEWGKDTKAILKEYARDKLKSVFVQTDDTNELEKQEVAVEAFAVKLFDDVKRDIIGLENRRIVVESEKIIKERQKSRQVSKVKLLLIEGIILGFVVGLIVNQFTEFIGFLKGQSNSTNVSATLWVIFGLLIFAIIFVFVLYLNKVEEYFYKKEVSKNGSQI